MYINESDLIEKLTESDRRGIDQWEVENHLFLMETIFQRRKSARYKYNSVSFNNLFSTTIDLRELDYDPALYRYFP